MEKKMNSKMKNKLYKTLRAKGYSRRECGYAFNRWGKNFAKSSFRFLCQDAEWHIKWLRDQAYVGTDAYQGMAYFWSHEYRHYLRDCKDSQRIRVHDAFVKEALSLSGESPRHLEIIKEAIPFNRKM